MESITQLQLFGDEDFTLETGSRTAASGDSPDDETIAFLTDIRRIALPMLSVRSFVYTPLSRVEEIARILGGIEVTAAQRDAAREMIAEYRKGEI